MLGSTFVETAIGLSLLYLMLSLMCSVAWEWIAKQGALRAIMMKTSIAQMLGPSREEFYRHPLIRALGTSQSWAHPFLLRVLRRAEPDKWHPPSYIPSALFARVLADIVKPKEDGALQDDRQKALAALVAGSPPGESAAAWFDAVMERLSARYKRLTQTYTFVIAIPLVCAINADTILIANRLQRDKSLRDTIVAGAATFVKDHPELATPSAPPAGTATPAPAGSGSAAAPPAAAAAGTGASGQGQGSGAAAAPSRFVELAVQLEKLSLPIGWPTDEEEKSAQKAEQEAAKKDEAAATAASAAQVAAASAATDSDAKAKSAALALTARRKKAGDHRNAERAARTAADADADAAKRAVDKAKAELADAQADLDALKAEADEDRTKADKAKVDRDTAVADAKTMKSAHEAATLANNEIKLRGFSDLSRSQILGRIAGWLLTALAISLGASFWFDTLGKLFNIRGGGAKPEKATK